MSGERVLEEVAGGRRGEEEGGGGGGGEEKVKGRELLKNEVQKAYNSNSV